MTDLLGSGETRVSFVPHLRDPSAPTPEELTAGTDLTPFTSDLEITVARDKDAVLLDFLPSRTRYLTMTFHQVRFNRRTVLKIERAIARRLRDPQRVAMHADYARRRRARQRRR